MRLFIALPIPEPVKAEIERVQSDLRRALPRRCARWTKCEQFHLTLKFLGNIETRRVPELADAVSAACRAFPALKMRAERIGCFPDLRFPRVVWVWVHDAAEQLPVLQKAIEQAVAEFTESKAEKNFTGHVTIGRTHAIKRRQAEVLARLAHSLTERYFGEWTADKVELLRSDLSSTGAVHSVLAVFPLTGRARGIPE